MPSYTELQQQIRALRQLADQARAAETAAAKARIHAIMREHGLTLADLTLADLAPAGQRPQATAADAKYRAPDSGETWSGKGRPPKWIAGKDPVSYLIK